MANEITTTYRDRLQTAQQRTIKFGLRCPDLVTSHIEYLTLEKQESFPTVVHKAVGELSVGDIITPCMSIHSRLKSPLEEFFNCPIIHTIGYVEYDSGFLFEHSEEELASLVNKGITGPELSLHTWLTLPSDEIIDMSLCTNIALMQNLDFGHGMVIANHAEKLTMGLKYHPTLLGEDALHRINLVAKYFQD